MTGGKRYDLATAGRRLAHATYYASHGTDQESALSFAMDLTPLVEDPGLSVADYVLSLVDRFRADVSRRVGCNIKGRVFELPKLWESRKPGNVGSVTVFTGLSPRRLPTRTPLHTTSCYSRSSQGRRPQRPARPMYWNVCPPFSDAYAPPLQHRDILPSRVQLRRLTGITQHGAAKAQ